MNIPIFLPSDNNYAPYLATMMASILDNTKSFIDFYILDGGISEENKEKIRSLNNQFKNFSVEFLKIDMQKYFSDVPVEKVYTKSTYNRFLISKLKPELEKAIYLDSDMMVLDDIQKLYEINLDGYMLGAVPEGNTDSFVSERKEELGIKGHLFFSSATLLIDVPKWVENNITEKLFETEKLYRDKLRWADMDCLNIVFKNNYKPIENVFNYNAADVLLDSQKDIVVRHFNGFVKPWQLPEGTENDVFPDLDIFWKYAKLTSFYDKMKQNAEKSAVLAKRHCQIYKIDLIQRNKNRS